MKLVWFICFLSSIAYISFQLVQLIIAYFQRDVFLTLRYISDYTMEFPAVVICHLNNPNISLDRMLVSCSFNGDPCDMSYFGSTISVTYGLCYHFNNFKNGQEYLRSIKAGSDFGLTIELFVGLPSAMSKKNRRTGVAVAVYNGSSRPSFAEEMFRVAPGIESSFMVNREIINKLPKPYSNCLENNTDPNAYFTDEFKYNMQVSKIYRQVTCISLCSTKREFSSKKIRVLLLAADHLYFWANILPSL